MFLNASGNNITALRKGAFDVRHIKILDLSNNKMAVIEEDAMTVLENLIFLYLGSNEIVSLNQDVFRINRRLEFLKLDKNILDLPVNRPFLDIPSLKSLDMSSCNIKSLPEKTFVSLPSLEELRLVHNRIKNLDPKVFVPLKSLKSLYLSGNLLRTLQKDMFVMMKELVILDLSNNKLQVLHPQVFTFLGNVDLLELSSNMLETLEVGVFTPLTSLKRLHLHKNMLNNLNGMHFSELNHVAVLDISGNLLDSSQLNVICYLKYLTYLKLTDNRLACDCALWKLRKWSIENGVRVLSTCEEPDFEFSVNNSDSLQFNKSCNGTFCGTEAEKVFPKLIISPVYRYTIIFIGLLLVLVACVVTVCAVFKFRKEFCKRRKDHVLAAQYCQDTLTFVGRQNYGCTVHAQYERELKEELHRQHQETLLKNRVARELNLSQKALPRIEYRNFRHSYHEGHLPTVAYYEMERSKADALPCNSRTSVFLENMSVHPIKQKCLNSSKNRSVSEPELKECPENFLFVNGTSSEVAQNTHTEEPKNQSTHDLSSSSTSETVTPE
jgi:Leucine-rich repeat (LRR) protein